MKKIKVMAGVLLLGGLFFGFVADKRKISADTGSSYIAYTMEHPLHNWDARSAAVRCIMVYDGDAGKIEAVAVVAPVKSFDSGNTNRDSHAIEVLEGLKYPNVTFSSTSVTDDGSRLQVKGNLNFHGVTQPVSFSAVRKTEKGIMNVSGDFAVNMTDYKIDPPTLMGVKTKEIIRLTFGMNFRL